MQDLLLNDDPVIQNILVSDFLDLQIAFDVAFFLFDGNKVRTTGKDCPEKITEIRSHFHHLLVISILRHPDDRIQGIIQKMRVDLCLQKLHFRNVKVLLLLPDPRDQARDFLAHLVEGARKNINLFQASRLCPGIPVSVSQALCRHFQAADRPGHRIGQHGGKHDSGRQNDCQQNHKCINALPGVDFQVPLQILHVAGFVINIFVDIILDHGTQALDIIFPNGTVLIIPPRLVGILNHLLHCFFQGIKAG